MFGHNKEIGDKVSINNSMFMKALTLNAPKAVHIKNKLV